MKLTSGKIENSIDNLRLKIDQLVGLTYDLKSEAYNEFCVAVEQMYFDIDGKNIKLVTYEKWKNDRDKIDLCPCDNHPTSLCETCRGACSCHWDNSGPSSKT